MECSSMWSNERKVVVLTNLQFGVLADYRNSRARWYWTLHNIIMLHAVYLFVICFMKHKIKYQLLFILFPWFTDSYLAFYELRWVKHGRKPEENRLGTCYVVHMGFWIVNQSCLLWIHMDKCFVLLKIHQ